MFENKIDLLDTIMSITKVFLFPKMANFDI